MGGSWAGGGPRAPARADRLGGPGAPAPADRFSRLSHAPRSHTSSVSGCFHLRSAPSEFAANAFLLPTTCGVLPLSPPFPPLPPRRPAAFPSVSPLIVLPPPSPSLSNRLALAYGELCDDISAGSLPEEIGEDGLISLHAVLSSAGREDLVDAFFSSAHAGGGERAGAADDERDEAEEEADEADGALDADADGSRPSGLLARPFPSSFGRMASLHDLSKSLLLAFSSRAGDDEPRARAPPAEAEPSSSRDPCAGKGTSLRASLEALASGCWRARSWAFGAPSKARRGGRRWGDRWAAALDAEEGVRAHERSRVEAELDAALGRAAMAHGTAGAGGLRARPCARAVELMAAGESPRHRHHQPRAGSSSSASSSASFSLASMAPLNGGQLVVDDLGGLVGVWGADRSTEETSMADRLGVPDADFSEALKSERVRLRAVQQVGEGVGAEVDPREASVDPPLVLDEEAPEAQAVATASLRRLAAHHGHGHGMHGGRHAPLDLQRGGRFARSKPGRASSSVHQNRAVEAGRAAGLADDPVVRAQVADEEGEEAKVETTAGASFLSSIPASFKDLLDLGSAGDLESAVGRQRGIVKRLERDADGLASALEDEANAQAGAIATKVWRTKNGDLLALAE